MWAPGARQLGGLNLAEQLVMQIGAQAWATILIYAGAAERENYYSANKAARGERRRRSDKQTLESSRRRPITLGRRGDVEPRGSECRGLNYYYIRVWTHAAIPLRGRVRERRMLELVLIPFGFATDVAAILITRRRITNVCKFGTRICMQMRFAMLKYVSLRVFGLFHCTGFIVRQSSLW